MNSKPISLQLPTPNSAMQQHSEKLCEHIKQIILGNNGKISFAQFMQEALYAPGLGYYSAGSRKLGKAGDFITAPELSPLFSYCLANQCQEVFNNLSEKNILELGAGSGKMASDILTRLRQLNCLPENYFILEVSADLRERQQQLLQGQQPDLFKKIIWLDKLPKDFIGVVLANEVIDALPVNLFQWQENQLFEHIVKLNKAGEIDLGLEPASADLLAAFEKIKTEINIKDWQTPYSSEINLLLDGWIKALANCLKQGAILLIDYGQVRKHFYHPQRNKGTLMCHFQHHAHSDPITLIGLQDITAHVDFTAVADSATEAGLTLEGFCTQASFLLNCGLTDLAGKLSQEETVNENTVIKKLTHPNEMGEVFKVIGFSRDLDGFLRGFDNNDISKKL